MPDFKATVQRGIETINYQPSLPKNSQQIPYHGDVPLSSGSRCVCSYQPVASGVLGRYIRSDVVSRNRSLRLLTYTHAATSGRVRNARLAKGSAREEEYSSSI